jgi:hypothetical protein
VEGHAAAGRQPPAPAAQGKPEPLRETLSGCWSRRIDDEHRLIDRLEGTTLLILACRDHVGLGDQPVAADQGFTALPQPIEG